MPGVQEAEKFILHFAQWKRMEGARESVQKLRRCAVVNIWVDPREYAPGTKNQTMYK